MQRLSRRLYTSVRPRIALQSSGIFSSRVESLSGASSSALWTANGRFFSASAAVEETEKLGRRARRRAKKQHISTSIEAAETDDDDTPLQNAQIRRKVRFNVHRHVVGLQMPLEDVLPLVQSEVRLKTLSIPVARQAVDSFFFYCAQSAEKKGLSEPFRLQLLQYFEDELFVVDERKPFVLGQELNEAAFGSVIKLHLAVGDTEAAWQLLTKLRRAVRGPEGESKDTPKLHFRTVSPLLEHECRNDQFVSAYTRWQQLKLQDVEWTTAMEDVLVQMVVACVKNDAKEKDSHFHAQMTSLLHDLQLACREVTAVNAQRLLQAFRDAGYTVEMLPSDARMKNKCSCCGHSLIKQGMTQQERKFMLAAIESRRSKVSPQKPVKEYLDPFRDWLMLRHETFQLENVVLGLEDDGPLHYVLDGPNIAYINQNFEAGTYRLDQVDAVARQLQDQGHLVSITMPAAYLAEKFVVRIHTKYNRAQRRQGKFVTRERTLEEKQILARWENEDMIFSCRTDFLSDDLFWLYASVLLGDEGRVVTNDQGRDHVFALLNGYTSTSSALRGQKSGKTAGASQDPSVPSISMDLVARWKDMTTVNIEIKHEEVTYINNAPSLSGPIPIEQIRLLHPLPFSRVPQATAPHHFHVPIADEATANDNQIYTHKKRTRWLCLHRKDKANIDK